jgi:hypothetical protein
VRVRVAVLPSLAVLASVAITTALPARAQSPDAEARMSAARALATAGDAGAARAALEAVIADPATSPATRAESLALLVVIATVGDDVRAAESYAAALVALDPRARLPADASPAAHAVLERALGARRSSGADVSIAWARGAHAGDCPAEDEIAERVRRRLGADPFARDAGDPSRHLEGWVDRLEGVLVATWVLRDEEGTIVGERSLRSAASGCGALADGAVLAAAIAIDPEAALRAESAASTVEAEPPAAIAPAAIAAPAAAVEDDQVAALAALEGGVLVGPLPHPGPVVGARGAVRIDRTFAIEGGAAWSPEIAQGGFAFGAMMVSLGGALAIADGDAGRLEVAIGGVLGLTDAHALPSAALEPIEAGLSAWGGPFAGARGELALGPVRVGARLDAIVALPARDYALAGSESVVHSSAPVALVAALYVGAEAP